MRLFDRVFRYVAVLGGVFLWLLVCNASADNWRIEPLPADVFACVTNRWSDTTFTRKMQWWIERQGVPMIVARRLRDSLLGNVMVGSDTAYELGVARLGDLGRMRHMIYERQVLICGPDGGGEWIESDSDAAAKVATLAGTNVSASCLFDAIGLFARLRFFVLATAPESHPIPMPHLVPRDEIGRLMSKITSQFEDFSKDCENLHDHYAFLKNNYMQGLRVPSEDFAFVFSNAPPSLVAEVTFHVFGSSSPDYEASKFTCELKRMEGCYDGTARYRFEWTCGSQMIVSQIWSRVLERM